MNISIVSLFPDLYTQFLQTSLIKRAQDQLVQIEVKNLFSFVEEKKRIDSPVFGHGSGMVLRPEIVQKGVEWGEEKYGVGYKIFFSPSGRKLNQISLQKIAQKAQEFGHLMLFPARYEGMDERVEKYYADELVSLGDFVLMGGDLPAMVLLEGLLRLIPGVVGKKDSVEKESFQGPFVDFPAYADPVVWKNMSVPEVVRSGNHAAIVSWEDAQRIEKTVIHHFQWLRSFPLTSSEKRMARNYIPKHYVVLNHADVLVGPSSTPGTTSVTSIDIHDIARSSQTYGVEQFFIVTPLKDQQEIVKTLLDFWKDGPGFSYNRSRFEALRSVVLKESMVQVISAIKEQEKKDPLVIATSARGIKSIPTIFWNEQERIWESKKPIVIVLGTGKGLSEEFITNSCDYLLAPIEGFSDFNHLSVRSAAAIILDRWMGINVAKEQNYLIKQNSKN